VLNLSFVGSRLFRCFITFSYRFAASRASRWGPKNLGPANAGDAGRLGYLSRERIVQLRREEGRVRAASLPLLVVGARFDDGAAAEDEDPLRASHRAEADDQPR
jgi:hypothetical protein